MTAPVDLQVVDDPAGELAARILAVARDGGDIVLTGGSTPRQAYERLAGEDLGGATLWFTDERCVEIGDERSNFGMVRTAMLDRLAGEPRAVHRMRGEDSCGEGAEAYDAALREAFGDAPGFDLVVLGLGPDTHIASLFPGHPELEERERWAVAVPEAGHEPYVPRISLTLPALQAGKDVVFLVTGEGKAGAVRRAFGPDREPSPDVPATLLDRPVTVLLDRAAAAEVDGT